MTPTVAKEPSAAPLDLSPTPPEIKHYHRLKLIAGLVSLALTLSFLGVTAIFFEPRLGDLIAERIGSNRWTQLAALGLLYAAGVQLLTLPLDFWSGFILEHRYELSNQTFLQWVWREIKGDLVGGPIGLLLL